MFYDEMKIDWSFEEMSEAVNLPASTLKKCVLLEGWFHFNNEKSPHVRAVTEDLKEKVNYEVASAMINIIGQIDIMPSLMKHQQIVMALGKAYHEVQAPLLTEKMMEWKTFMTGKVVSITKELGIVENLAIPDSELVHKKWKDVIKKDAVLRLSAENAEVNIDLILNGNARDEQKAKWAQAIRNARSLRRAENLTGETDGTGKKVVDLLELRKIIK